MSLCATEVTYRAAGNALLDSINFRVHAGDVVAVMGCNGAGKSTLLSVLAGCPAPEYGEVSLEGQGLQGWSPTLLAQRRAILTQSIGLQFDFTVAEVAALGSVPYEHRLGKRCIKRHLDEVLERLDVATLRNRLYTTLSGGERQRTQLARVFLQAVLGQESHNVYLLLDEPLAGLDVAHQRQCMEYCTRLADMGAGVVVALHDFNMALRYAKYACLLQAGRVVGSGEIDNVLTEENICQVFGVRMRRVALPERHHDCAGASSVWV